MPRNRTNPQRGVDLLAARRELRGVPARALDVDWFALDKVGNVAVFLGDDTSPMPSRADGESTSAALEAVVRAVTQRTNVAALDGAYRVAASRAQEPIFDPPRSSLNKPLHERPFQGYPHLVVAKPDGAEHVRRLLSASRGREVLARDSFAVVLDQSDDTQLHHHGVCGGCRVLDDPKDPRIRAPEVLAQAGLYVYGFTSSGWGRIVSPSAPADRADLLEMAHLTTTFVALSFRFEDSRWLPLSVR